MALSREGHRQSSALAEYLRDKRFDALYASPMRRAQQTLAPLLAIPRLPQPVLRSELREVDFGDWTGLSWSRVQRKFGVSPFTWLEQLEQDAIPNAECATTLRGRVEPCLRDFIRRHKGQQVAVLCHGGVIRMMLAILMGWKFSSLAGFEIEYTSITRVDVAHHRVRLQLLNFVPWRDLNHSRPGPDAHPMSDNEHSRRSSD